MIDREDIQRQAEARLKERKISRDENLKEIERLIRGKEFNWTKVEEPSRLAERAKRLGLFEDAGSLLRDPTNTELGRRVFEKIIDANNLLDVNFLFKGAQMARAVGRITLPVSGGTRLGTGFMVSSRIMMTNNHVLSNLNEAGNAVLEFDFYQRENGTTGPVIRFRLQPDLFFITDSQLDFTLAAVEDVNIIGNELADRGWFPLIGPSGKAVVGERVSIIQHPNGMPQKITVHDNKIVDVNFKDNFIHYETDTMGGSSGSPVLNIDWDLVALHHAAVGASNEGVRISSICRYLRELIRNESAMSLSNIDSDLLNELMEAKIPIHIKDEDIHPASRGGDQPRINADGTVSWTVPITVTLGVGQASGPAMPAARGAPAASQGGIPDKRSSLDDEDLRAAIQALEDTEVLEYYNAEKDKGARDEYYSQLGDTDRLDKDGLFRELSRLLAKTHTRTLSYKKARLNHLYPWIDRREEGSRELRGIYTDQVFDALEIIRMEAAVESRREQAIAEKARLESLEAVDEEFLEELEASLPYNCEHVVPQSWFNKRKQPRTDLHHLFTCEGKCNSFRGNRAYFDFSTEAYRDSCGESDAGKFEPIHGKGAAARATLYFLLRYPEEVADSNKEMPIKRIETLIQWSEENEVSTWERHRNAEIQKVQGNRNPLIDFPELAGKINFELGFV